MPTPKSKHYSSLLKDFKKKMLATDTETKARVILLIMANTHDSVLSKDCEKDVEAIQTAFKKICQHFNMHFCSLVIAGDHYHYNKLDRAISSIDHTDEEDVILFYYTGHGFSYQKDGRNKYPQLDMRPHNKQVRHNKIEFIKENTINLHALLNIMRFRGCRVNIVIADCCNTTIPFKRSELSEKDMNVSRAILPPKIKTLTKKMFTDDDSEVCIIVSSSQMGQPAITDSSMGSLFTHFFTQALGETLKKPPKGEAYIPWVPILKKSAAKAFKESKSYDIGGGVPGKQKAVFEVYFGKE